MVGRRDSPCFVWVSICFMVISDHTCLHQKSRRLWPLVLYDASIKVRHSFSCVSAHVVPSWTLSHGHWRKLGSQSVLASFLSGNLGYLLLAITPVGRYTSSLFFCCLKTDMQQSIDPLVRRTSWFLNTGPCEQTARVQGIGLHRRCLSSSRATTGQKKMKNYQLLWDLCIHGKYVWVVFYW